MRILICRKRYYTWYLSNDKSLFDFVANSFNPPVSCTSLIVPPTDLRREIFVLHFILKTCSDLRVVYEHVSCGVVSLGPGVLSVPVKGVKTSL